MNLMTASDQWASRPADQRFQTLAALRESVHSRRMLSRSTDIELVKTKVSVEDGHLIVNSAIAPCEPSHWAFTQLAGQVKAPAAYLRTLPKPLLVDCLNEGLNRHGATSSKFMTVSDPAGAGLNTLQAVTSPTYGRIWDADVVDAVGRIVERTDGKFYNPLAYDIATGAPKPSGLYASDRDVFMFMIDGGSRLDVGPRAKLNRGFFVWNSEVGARTFGLTTFLFNEVCGNHIIWGAQNVNSLVIRHTQGGPARFDQAAVPALMDYVQSSAAAEETAVRAAMDRLLPTGAGELETLVAPFKFSRLELSEAIAAAKREEGRNECRTLWDLVQGLTAYARGFDYVDARVDLETRAGKLLQLVAS